MSERQTQTNADENVNGQPGETPGTPDKVRPASPTEQHAEPVEPTTPPPSPPPRRTLGWGMILAVAAAFAVALVLGIAFGDRLSAAFERAWHVAGFGKHELVEETAADGTTYWTCGMHPWVILPEPGECPICHMDLVPLDPDKFTGELAIDPTVVQNIGVRIEPVVLGPLVRSVRTVGNVTYDETRVTNVNTKFSGWIEDLRVDSVGEPVKKGEVLFEVYSPELYSAQEEYLLALRSAQEAVPGVAEANQQLLESARTRLKFFDLSDEQIAELEERGEPARTVAVESPYSGVVIEKMATEGMRIDPGMRVYRIADLSEVWVQATVYEYQLPYVREGQAATMTLPYLPGQTFEGEVVYLYPYLSEETREATVRLEFDNPGGRLKPGMFANVMLRNTLGEEEILAPQAAVIETGKRQVAFVSLGEGRFEPRNVETGVETEDGMVQILKGLEPGEQVVTSGQFLIDSESRMREALAKMITGDLAAEQEPVIQSVKESELASLPQAAEERINLILDTYLEIGVALADDQLEGIDPRAERLAIAAEALGDVEVPGKVGFWDEHSQQLTTLREQSQALSEAADLEQARHEYAVMSDALDRLLRATGVPPSFDRPLNSFICGFLQDAPRDGMWLQVGDEPRNPLMGEASGMLACHVAGETQRLPVTGGATTAGPTGQPDQRPQPAQPVPETEQPSEALTPLDLPLTETPTQPTGEVPVARSDEGETPEQADVAALPEPAAATLSDLLNGYFTIADHLAMDSAEGVKAPAEQIAVAADRLLEVPMPANANFWAEHDEVLALRDQALALADATDLAQARLAFADLSDALAELTEATGIPATYSRQVEQLHCPMFRGEEDGALWLQPAGDVRNPYMGQAMLTCQDEREALPVTPVGESGAQEVATQPADEAGPVGVTVIEQAHVDALTKAYLALQQMLYEGEHEEARQSLVAMAEAAKKLAETDNVRLRNAAEAVIAETAETEPGGLPDLRATFKSLSMAVMNLLEVAPPSAEIGTLYTAYCPMAKGSWLQVGQQIKNPYYGEAHAMADCGDIQEAIAPRAEQ